MASGWWLEEDELVRKFEEGEIADEPDQSVEFETVEEWLAIADLVFRKKRLHELIARAKTSKENNGGR